MPRSTRDLMAEMLSALMKGPRSRVQILDYAYGDDWRKSARNSKSNTVQGWLTAMHSAGVIHIHSWGEHSGWATPVYAIQPSLFERDDAPAPPGLKLART